MNARRAIPAAIGFGLLLTVVGCGFQLQGRQVLPPALDQIRVEVSDRQSEFTRALRSSLAAAGSQLVEASAGTDDSTVAVVSILSDEMTERVLSVDARNIPTDYELTYRVEVQVRAQQRELMALEAFELSRIYSFDERRQLAKDREKEILRDALARDLASVVTRRLSTLQ
jgi:outer membrane lipopolysaccharide assembly protein LptE/RlpB